MSASPASRLNEALCLIRIREILPLGRRLIGERQRPILYPAADRALFRDWKIRDHRRLGRATSSELGPRGGDEGRHQHGKDEQCAEGSGLCVPRRVREREAVPKVQDNKNREDHTGHRSRAAKDTDATKQDHRDDVELEALGGAAPNGPEARHEENAGEGGNEAAHREDGQLHAPDADTREPRDLRVAPHDVRIAAEAGELEQHGRADEEPREDDERQRERADKGLLAEPAKPVGETADRPVSHEKERGAAIADQPREGNRERWQTDNGYPVAVEEPAEGADEKSGDNPGLEGNALLFEPGDEDSREPHH